jgi:hypothetical protein
MRSIESLKAAILAHAGKTYAPNMLQRVALSIMALLTLISFTLANVQALLWVKSDWLVSTILPAVIVELTNEERGDDAVLPLRRSETLDLAATMKARHMAENRYFAHYSPDGISPWHWFDEAGYSFTYAGENLAVLFTDSEEVVEAWMESPGHKANLLSSDYTEIGVGTAEGVYKGKQTVFIVQLFGTPAEVRREIVSSVPTIVANVAGETDSSASNTSAENERLTESAKDAPLSPAVAGEQRIVAAAEVPAEVPASAAIVSDTISTSREGVVAKEEVGFFPRIATQPGWLGTVYGFLAFTVLLLLAWSIVLAFKHDQKIQIIYGTGLLGLMAFLLVLHGAIVGSVMIL